MERSKAIRQLVVLQKDAAVMRLAAEGWKEEWQTLIAILMSARTRDETTIKAAKKLFAKYKNLTALAAASAAEAKTIVRPVNFYRNKAKNVISAAKTISGRFGGNVPRDIEKLVAIPGVGRKTANVFLAEYGTDAIGVDTHVSYISQKLGWTARSNPREIEKDLEKLFPRNYWNKVNGICVRFGKTYQSRKRKDELLQRIKRQTK